MLGRFAALLAIAALAAAPLAHKQAKADDHEVVIGFAIAFSGWMNQYDGPPYQGSLMAIEEFNAQGGILGKQIRAVTADTKTDTVQGAKAGADVVAQGAQFMVVSCDYDMGGPRRHRRQQPQHDLDLVLRVGRQDGRAGDRALRVHAQHLRAGRGRGHGQVRLRGPRLAQRLPAIWMLRSSTTRASATASWSSGRTMAAR